MTDINVKLYDVNKQILANANPLDLNEVKVSVAHWLHEQSDEYFMLLCRERNDYTLLWMRPIFYIDQDVEGPTSRAADEILETLMNRGCLVATEISGDEYFQLWVNIDGEVFLYMLFPYDSGVITV